MSIRKLGKGCWVYTCTPCDYQATASQDYFRSLEREQAHEMTFSHRFSKVTHEFGRAFEAIRRAPFGSGQRSEQETPDLPAPATQLRQLGFTPVDLFDVRTTARKSAAKHFEREPSRAEIYKAAASLIKAGVPKASLEDMFEACLQMGGSFVTNAEFLASCYGKFGKDLA